MNNLCLLLDGRTMHVWSINEEDETVDVFPSSDYDVEVDVPETVKDHLVLCIDSNASVLDAITPPAFTDFWSDLAWQIDTIDELDWDYFLETTEKAKASAIREGLFFRTDDKAHSLGGVSEIDLYRKKIRAELEKPLELDWAAFERLVIDARELAVRNDVNMSLDRVDY